MRQQSVQDHTAWEMRLFEVKLALKANPDLMKIRDSERGCSLLHIAASRGGETIIRFRR